VRIFLLKVSWDKSNYAPVTGYKVMYRPKESDVITSRVVSDSDTMLIIEGLFAGTEYHFQVAAMVGRESGAPSGVHTVLLQDFGRESSSMWLLRNPCSDLCVKSNLRD